MQIKPDREGVRATRLGSLSPSLRVVVSTSSRAMASFSSASSLDDYRRLLESGKDPNGVFAVDGSSPIFHLFGA